MKFLPPETRPDGLVWETVCPGEEPWKWSHFDLVHSAARGAIDAIESLPEEARELLVGNDESLRLEFDGQTVFGVLPGLEGQLNDEEFSVSAWRFAARPGLLVTCRRAPVTALGEAYRFLAGGGPIEDPAALIDRVINRFTGAVRRELASLAERLDDAEDALLEHQGGAAGDFNAVIGMVRRRATRLKRVMAPLDRIFHDEDADLPDWSIEEVYERLRRQIHAAADDLVALKDRARSLQDELSARQAEQANQRLYIVSVVTTLMLPASFVTGFFGMNTGGMFLASGHGHIGTIAAGLVCVFSMLAMFGFLKFKKLL